MVDVERAIGRLDHTEPKCRPPLTAGLGLKEIAQVGQSAGIRV